jgi:transposase
MLAAKEATMGAAIELEDDDLIVGMDLAGEEHPVVLLSSQGRRLTCFKIPHSIAGFEELTRRCRPEAWQRPGGRRLFAFEATGHVWESLAHHLETRGERYVVVNPLATFRLREARQLDRRKTDEADAEQIAELVRSGMVTRTQLLPPPYLCLRRAYGEFSRIRYERARLKTLLTHQLFAFFPEFVTAWSDLGCAGALAVLRSGLTPREIASMSTIEFVAAVEPHKRGRRLFRYKLVQVHQRAKITVAPADAAEPLRREIRRIVARIDLLSDQLDETAAELEGLLASIEEATYLRTLPGMGLATVAGLIAHIGPIDRYRHGRQLIKLAGINPSRCESGTFAGRTRMTLRGRAGLRFVLYMATVSALQHNPRIRAHYDRLVQRPDRPLPKMQAIGACMSKLLLYVFAVMKRREPFDVSHRWTAGEAAMAA